MCNVHLSTLEQRCSEEAGTLKSEVSAEQYLLSVEKSFHLRVRLVLLLALQINWTVM